MYISGYGLDTSYYSYLYSSAANTAGLTSDSLNPIEDVLASKIQNTPSVQTDYRSGSTAFQDIMSLQYKMLKEQEYNAELEDARINHPQKYEDMQAQREQDITKSFFQLEENARKNGNDKTGMATYKGIAISFDFENNAITVGDMSSGDIIHVGKLSNGYSFSFNRDNIDDVSKMLDLFSPEDINKIMEAITKDNMAKSMEQEIEDEKAKVGETAQVDETTPVDEVALAIEDLDQSAAVGGKGGIGFSVYYMNRASNAYEDSFVYAR